MRESIREIQSSNFEIMIGSNRNSECFQEDQRDYNLRQSNFLSRIPEKYVARKYVTLHYSLDT